MGKIPCGPGSSRLEWGASYWTGTKEGSARVKSASLGCGVKDRANYLLTEF